MNKIFYIDLVMTKNCNFRCTYCYERGKYTNESVSYETIDQFIKFVDDFRKSSLYINNYESININIFGGEPTLELEKIDYILNHYKEDDSVFFLIFTNGSNDKILNVLQKYDKKIKHENKIHTQISYDGWKVHERNRKYKNGSSSTKQVRDLISKFMNTDFSFSLKSTLRVEDFDLLYETYLEFKELNREYKNNNAKLSYFPTFDYSQEHKTDLNFLRNKKILEENLELIAKDCIKEQENVNLFKLFTSIYDNKSCDAGMQAICVDVDGKIYKCHGVIYNDIKDPHFINNIRNEDAVAKVEFSIKEHTAKNKELDKKCNCYAVFCINCNAMKYSYSEKEDYYDKWYDKLCQPIFCEYMKSVSKYSIAVHNTIKKEH